jgi:hyperosmotically inducible protein
MHVPSLRRLLIVAVLVSLAGASLAAGGDDRQLQAAVVRTLQDHKIRRGNNVQVMASGSTVTLSGEVRSLWEKNEAIRLARAVEGVSTLVSDLTIAMAESDKKIVEALTDRVLHYGRYSVFDDIDARVKNGVVTLGGFVTDPVKSDDILDMASRIQGVQSVQNHLEAYPVSQSDDRLRVELATRIYQHPDLQDYARQANPPIHIIVMNGRVTLKGYVYAPLDKQRIEGLVRENIGVMKLDDQLQIAR